MAAPIPFDKGDMNGVFQKVYGMVNGVQKTELIFSFHGVISTKLNRKDAATADARITAYVDVKESFCRNLGFLTTAQSECAVDVLNDAFGSVALWEAFLAEQSRAATSSIRSTDHTSEIDLFFHSCRSERCTCPRTPRSCARSRSNSGSATFTR